MDPYTATMLAIAKGLELWLYILQHTPAEILEKRATEAYEAEKWWRERFDRASAFFESLKDRESIFKIKGSSDGPSV